MIILISFFAGWDLVVSGSRNGAVYVWSSTSSKCLVRLSGARAAVWSVMPLSPPTPMGRPLTPRALAKLVVSSQDSKARTYQLKLESLERAAYRAQGRMLHVEPTHVMHAHSMPILCMDCCAITETAVMKAVRKSSGGAPAATVDVVALGSAGAARPASGYCCHILCTRN